jgi:hypothetical protein
VVLNHHQVEERMRPLIRGDRSLLPVVIWPEPTRRERFALDLAFVFSVRLLKFAS